MISGMIDVGLKQPSLATQIWIAAGVTDMRRGLPGLAAQVQTVLAEKPYSGHVFAFRGRRGDTVKLLWFDGDGLCLFQKRLETRALCMAPGDDGRSVSKPRPVVDVAGRDRLENASSNGGTRDECLSILFIIHEAFLL